MRHEIQRVIKEWRAKADAHAKRGDVRDDPYDDLAVTWKMAAKVRREAADELSAILASSQQQEGVPQERDQGWQDIASAPERRKVMVSWVNDHGKRRTTFASYWPAGTLDINDDAPDDLVDEHGRNVEGGWWESCESGGDDQWLDEPLTHWRPLPDPPASLGADTHEGGVTHP